MMSDLKIEQPITGIHILNNHYSTINHETDLIFIHGFHGNVIENWLNMEESLFWPKGIYMIT